MSHYQTECTDCKKVISQCRCVGPKQLTYTVCTDCQTKRERFGSEIFTSKPDKCLGAAKSAMTNTTEELRKRFDRTKFSKEGGSCFECCDYETMLEDQWTFIQSEIEAAARAKMEEVIGEAEVEYARMEMELENVTGDAEIVKPLSKLKLGGAFRVIAQLRQKFLKKPE